MISPEERAALFRSHHGCLAVAAGDDEAFGAAEQHTTPAGRWIDLGDPIPGLLTLVDGHAVVEIGARPTSTPGAIPPDAVEVLAGRVPDRGARFGTANACRTRLGVGECLRMRPLAFERAAREAWPSLSVYALSPLTWMWQRERGQIHGPNPRSPLDDVHDDYSRYLNRSVQPLLAGFAIGSALSFDAARVIASFGQVVRLVKGETLHDVGDDVHAGILMSGSLSHAGKTVLPGDTIHPERFGPGPFAPLASPDAITALQDSVVSIFTHQMLSLLANFDPRPALAAPLRPSRIVHVVVGDADEARPDGQTMALQTAATIAKTMVLPGVPSGVLYVDLDGPRFKARLPSGMGALVPLVADLGRVGVLPDVDPWRARGLALALVSIDPTAVPDVAAAVRLVELLAPASPGNILNVIVRVPRRMSAWMGPLYARAYTIGVSSDHLLDPVPNGVPAASDLLRMRRFGRRESTPLVDEMAEVRFERSETPTNTFWTTGVPWCLA